MKCPYCEYQDSKVIDSRGIDGGVRRRRQCLHCGSRFTTYERTQGNSFLVIKKDGRREEFSRDKLALGIHKACTKRPIANEAIERLVDKIEDELHQLGKVEVTSSTIGGLVMDYLRELDRIAYIRFASVYREFADVEHFKQEVDALVGSPAKIPAAQLPLLPQGELLASAKRQRKRK
ncbi:MAG TPA: transcriptional regulator NrdR [Dehalococcoidia bacterium]|nr:transcriptional regulator NrdR [Dehalococcoidia bacterium]